MADFIWWLIGLPTLALDVLWWVVAFRFLKNPLLRILLSLFMLGQVIILLFGLSGFDLAIYLPKTLVVVSVVWHRFGLLVASGFFIVMAFLRARSRFRRLRARSIDPAPPGEAHTRRAFLESLHRIGSFYRYGWAQQHWLGPGESLSSAALDALRSRTASCARRHDIAQVSDMHVGHFTRGKILREMVETTNGLDSDLVLLTGDLIHHSLVSLPEAVALVQAMRGRYGLWMIEGNHDLFQDPIKFTKGVRTAGIQLLQDESAITEVRGHPIQLLGLRWLDRHDDPTIAAQLDRLLMSRQADAFPILMAHHPHAFDAAIKAGLPLTLSGHTHGGQWMLSQTTGLGPMLFRYWSGLYQRGNSQLVVSNGVGNMHPVRLNAPAEILHLTLRAAAPIG